MSPKLKIGLIVGGVVLGVLVVLVIGLTLLGPMVGSTFSGTVSSLEPGAGGYDEDLAREKVVVVEEAAEAESWEVPAPEQSPLEPQADDLAVSNAGSRQTIQRLIIRTGNISMQVEDTLASKEAIETMVSEMASEGAFIVYVNEYGGDEDTSPYINMAIRVPATHFDEVMDRLADMAVEGTTPSRSESGEDVTEEYVDVKARLESLEAARERLLSLMENAQTTEELLMAEQQLTQREAEIEGLKGRMQYLEQAALLSRIDIDLQPYILSQPVDTRWRPAETAREGVEALINGLRNFGDFAIFASIACLPWLLVGGAVIYGIVRLVMWRVRVRREKRAAAEAIES